MTQTEFEQELALTLTLPKNLINRLVIELKNQIFINVRLGNTAILHGLGKFHHALVENKNKYNINTGQIEVIPAHLAVRMTAARYQQQALNANYQPYYITRNNWIWPHSHVADQINIRTGIDLLDCNNFIFNFITVLIAKIKLGETVSINNLGTFAIYKKMARNGRDPRTGETIQIAAKDVIKFRPSKALKDWIN